MMNKLILMSIIIITNAVHSQTVTIRYSELSKAYEDYDTAFFNNLKGKTVDVTYKNRYLRRNRVGEGFVPWLDWYLNKKGSVSEWDFKISNDTMSVFVYNMKDDQLLKIMIKKTGPKPRVYFRKGRRHWFLPEETKDCEIIFQDYIKNESL